MSSKKSKKEDKDVTVCVILPESMLNEIDNLSAAFSISSRSLMVRNLLDIAITDARTLNATGAVNLFRYLKDMKEELLRKDKQLKEILQKENKEGLVNV